MTDMIREYILEEERVQTMDTDTYNTKNDNSDTTTAKVVAMVSLFVASYLLGVLPLKLSKYFNWDSNSKNKRWVGVLLCFGGGVLLCTTFLHLLPEVSENIKQLVSKGLFPDLKINFAELLMCIGFFFMYFVEECVHAYLHRRIKKNEMRAFKRGLSIRRGDLSADSESVDASSNSSANLVKIDEEFGKDFAVRNDHNPNVHDHAGHSHVFVEEDSVVKSMRGLLVVLALSIHELFEGLAIGLEASSTNVWYMFAAVSAHKFVISFCIGVELISTKTKTALILIYLLLFAIVSPLGIGIGIVVSIDQHSTTLLVSMVLQGLAAGTLLYVVFFEILQKDRSGGLIKYSVVLLGFSVMFGITILSGHDHGHGPAEAAVTIEKHSHFH